MTTGNQNRWTAGSFVMQHWPIIAAVIAMLIASGRADSQIQSTKDEVRVLRDADTRQDAAQLNMIGQLGRIEGKLDSVVGRISVPRER